MWDCFYGSVTCCVPRVRDNEDYEGQLEMGEILLVEMIVSGTPCFVLFPDISIQRNQLSFQIYLQTIRF